MLNVVAPEVLSNNPYDISWPEVPKGQPKCFIMNYFGKVMPHNYWVISRLMYDFVDDPYMTANSVMMYDVGNLLPDGTYSWSTSRRNISAIRVLSFGNKAEDSMRAQFLHEEMLREDSSELAEKGYLGLDSKDVKKLSIALRAAALSLASSYPEASEIIDSSRPMNLRGQRGGAEELF